MTDRPEREAWEPQPETLFTGRTGIGREIQLARVGDWIEIVYWDAEDERRGFALNPKYAGELTAALVLNYIDRVEELDRQLSTGMPRPAQSAPTEGNNG